MFLCVVIFVWLIPRPPTPTLFPYTTLFRSVLAGGHDVDDGVADRDHVVFRLCHESFRVARGAATAGTAPREFGALTWPAARAIRSEEHTSELQSRENLVCRLLLEKKKNTRT